MSDNKYYSFPVKIRTTKFIATNYCLINKQNKFLVLSDGMWKEVLSDKNMYNLTYEDFERYGMRDLSLIPCDKWEELGVEFEILIWTDNIYTVPKLELTVPPTRPYKFLDEPYIVTYTEDEDVPVLFQTVLATSKVRFLVSKNKTNYYVYRDNEWIIIDKSDIIEKGMTKTELESIPQEAWAAWMEREAHKHSFNILIGMYSENPGKPLVRSVTVNYAENEAPVIINSVIEPDTIHNEFAYLMTDVKDYEGDRISFKVLIKKAGTEEFVQVDPPEGWHTGSGSEIGILRAYNHPYFNIGENEVKVVVKDERGVESEWTGRIILTNTDPTIAITYDDFGMIAVIGDDDDDDIAYRLSINGELVFDYTKFFPPKKRFEYLFDSSKLRFGEENTICLEVIDTHGGYAKEEFTVIGTYRGLMFKNENGEYFVDDRGNVLMDVLFGKTLIGGQTSETKKVILENRTGFPLADVKIFPEKADFVHGAVVEISPIEMPFTPVDIIKVLEILPNLGTKDFYIRVRTSRDAYQGGYFYINSTATPVTQ